MIILVIALLAVVIAAILLSKKKEEPKPRLQPQQPIRFELLDDNGGPIRETTEPAIQELQYFCIKDKSYHVSVWPKAQGIQNVDYIEFEIAGLSFRDDIDNYLGEHDGTLEADPGNEYDFNAIKILAADGHHVGYVPKDMTATVREFTSLPCPCYIYIGQNDSSYFSDCYIAKD